MKTSLPRLHRIDMPWWYFRPVFIKIVCFGNIFALFLWKWSVLNSFSRCDSTHIPIHSCVGGTFVDAPFLRMEFGGWDKKRAESAFKIIANADFSALQRTFYSSLGIHSLAICRPSAKTPRTLHLWISLQTPENVVPCFQLWHGSRLNMCPQQFPELYANLPEVKTVFVAKSLRKLLVPTSGSGNCC